MSCEVRKVSDLWTPLLSDCVSRPADAGLSAVTFFTTWVLILHPVLYLHPSLHGVSVLLAVVVATVGSYLTCVYPKHIVVPVGETTYTIAGPALWTVDLLVHQVPLWLVLWLYGPATGRRPEAYVTAAAILYVYLLCINVQEKYGITNEDVYCILCVTSAALVWNLKSSS